MRLYISGPMSGIEDHNFPDFRSAAGVLRSRGYEVEDPSEKGVIEGWQWVDYMRYGIRKLMDCDGIALLADWDASRGARLEVAVAVALDMPVRGTVYWTGEELSVAASVHEL